MLTSACCSRSGRFWSYSLAAGLARRGYRCCTSRSSSRRQPPKQPRCRWAPTTRSPSSRTPASATVTTLQVSAEVRRQPPSTHRTAPKLTVSPSHTSSPPTTHLTVLLNSTLCCCRLSWPAGQRELRQRFQAPSLPPKHQAAGKLNAPTTIKWKHPGAYEFHRLIPPSLQPAKPSSCLKNTMLLTD